MKRRDDYEFFVYILSNRSHILYIGVTNDLRVRVTQHRRQIPGTFTARYKVTRLVYFERYQYINNAIVREKELKHWTRAQKIALIESTTRPGKNSSLTRPSTPLPSKRRFPSGMTNKRDARSPFVVIPKGNQLYLFVIPEGNLRFARTTGSTQGSDKTNV